jgi:hypothetical protein
MLHAFPQLCYKLGLFPQIIEIIGQIMVLNHYCCSMNIHDSNAILPRKTGYNLKFNSIILMVNCQICPLKIHLNKTLPDVSQIILVVAIDSPFHIIDGNFALLCFIQKCCSISYYLMSRVVNYPTVIFD